MDYIGKIENDKKLCGSDRPVIIFGAGKDLERLLCRLEDMGVKDRVVCVCDNSRLLQGQKRGGMEVLSLRDAIKRYEGALYIVYNRYCDEISGQLVQNGITKIHLIRS